MRPGYQTTINKKKVILLSDRVITSLDSLKDEFVINRNDTANIAQKNVYFVIPHEAYQKAKEEHKGCILLGFWHSLYINGILNEANQSLKIKDDSAYYTLNISQDAIFTDISIAAFDNDTDELDGYKDIIYPELSKFKAIISPLDEIGSVKRLKLITYVLSVIPFMIAGTLLYFNYLNDFAVREAIDNETHKLDTELQITSAKVNNLKSQRYLFDMSKHSLLGSLLFLHFKNVHIVGSTNLDKVSLSSTSDINYLEQFSNQYPQFVVTEQIEKLSTISILNVEERL